MSKIKNIFGWIDEIMVKKSPVDSFSEEDWKQWNSYMIHRFVSQHEPYIEVANLMQRMPPQNVKEMYSAYVNLLPKKKVWSKYIKSKAPKVNGDLLSNISTYFGVNTKEASDYINILGKDKVKQILTDMGFEKKEITKLLKK